MAKLPPDKSVQISDERNPVKAKRNLVFYPAKHNNQQK